jgi:hypothetical protein
MIRWSSVIPTLDEPFVFTEEWIQKRSLENFPVHHLVSPTEDSATLADPSQTGTSLAMEGYCY